MGTADNREEAGKTIISSQEAYKKKVASMFKKQVLSCASSCISKNS
jgi:hypothetical protein